MGEARARKRSRSRLERERAKRLESEQHERERERWEREEPSTIVIVRGLPSEGLTEQRLEEAAWSRAVEAGCSMPNGVHFAYDKSTQQFRGFALAEFPHVEASKLFVEHAGGSGAATLDCDGLKLNLAYHHPEGTSRPNRVLVRDVTAEHREEPSSTLILKGLPVSSTEDSVSAAFSQYAPIRDLRHFARRGFAFVQFASIEDATRALSGFEIEKRSQVDGFRVSCGFAKDREDGHATSAERNFLYQQAMAAAEATAGFQQLAKQQVQEQNTTKALTGVNASMWATYMQTVAQSEPTPSANTFTFDAESKCYVDRQAGLYYDPSTMYFFTLDYKKYFVYDHEEQMLCLVDKTGKKVAGGERRPLPSSQAQEIAEAADRLRSRGTALSREKSNASSSRETVASSIAKPGGEHQEQATRPNTLMAKLAEEAEAEAKPIHFPGGDPLAKLQPPQQAAPQKRKKVNAAAPQVLGLASAPLVTREQVGAPGPITVYAQTPGPVTVYTQATRAAVKDDAHTSEVGTTGGLNPAPQARKGGDWICELCMRRFGSEEMLRKHELLSDLHKQNLAKLYGDEGRS